MASTLRLSRRFQTHDDVSIDFEGNDLDGVYEGLVKETGKKRITSFRKK